MADGFRFERSNDPESVLGGLEGAVRRRELADALDDTRSWVDPRGYRLSDRLWSNRQRDRAAIDRQLRESIAAGDGPIETAEKLGDYLTPHGREGITRKPRTAGPGLAAARTLARTETTRAFGRATEQASRLNRFSRGLKWNLSNAHTEPDDCDDRARRHSRGMGPGEYTHDEWPPYPGHPNEMCYPTQVTPSLDEIDAIVDQMRDELGIA